MEGGNAVDSQLKIWRLLALTCLVPYLRLHPRECFLESQSAYSVACSIIKCFCRNHKQQSTTLKIIEPIDSIRKQTIQDM